jgi:hypothetical protein
MEGFTVIVCTEFVATKEYHTSSSATPAHPARDCVAPTVVPAVFTQAAFTARLIAPVQLLFAGGGGGVVTHIEKVDDPDPAP